MSLGYDQIQIHPYEQMDLEELTLTKKINEHTRLYFTGVIPEDLQDSYVETTEKKPSLKSVNKMNLVQANRYLAALPSQSR